jgi:ParB family chromosome partitioning protein
VELSYLQPKEQTQLLDAMMAQEATPSLSQAQRMKKFSQQGKLSEDVMAAIMSEGKKEVDRITLSSDKLQRYFPKSYTPRQMEETILQLLSQWQKKRQRELER